MTKENRIVMIMVVFTCTDPALDGISTSAPVRRGCPGRRCRLEPAANLGCKVYLLCSRPRVR